MAKHRALIKPKFDAVLEGLEILDSQGIATWTRPRGGYFISLDTRKGLASTVVTMAAELGVKLTPAGATFPYGQDPNDNNIRIAPTFPSLQDVQSAVEVLVLCIQLATARQLI